MTERRFNRVRAVLIVILVLLLGGGILSGLRAYEVVDRIWELRLSPDTKHLAVMSDAGVTVYEPGGAGHIFEVARGRRVAFARNGEHVAVATPDRVTVHEVATGAEAAGFDVPNEWTTSLAWSPDSRLLAALADHRNTLQIWSLADGATRWTVDAHDDADYAVAFSPDGRTIATGGRSAGATSTQIRLRDVEKGDLLVTLQVPRHAFVKQVVFVDDGRAIMIPFSDGATNGVYDISDLESIVPIPQHPLGQATGPVALSSDGRYAATSGWGPDPWTKTTVVTDLRTNRVLFQTDATRGLWSTAAFAPVDGVLVMATSGGVLTRWSIPDGGLIERIDGLRRARRSSTWFVLVACMIGWLAAWVVVHIRARPHGSARADWFLIPTAGLCASVAIVALHALSVTDPTAHSDPIGVLMRLGMLEVACALGLGCMCLMTRSWRALIVTLLAMGGVLLATAYLWVQAVAAV